MKLLFSILAITTMAGCSIANKTFEPENGIFIQKDENGSILILGTFDDKKKNGIWTYYDKDSIKNQIYYENDSALYAISPAINFKILIDTIRNFRILIPKNWQTEYSSEKYKNLLLSGISPLFPGQIKPSYNLVLTPLPAPISAEKIITENIKELQKDTELIIIQQSKKRLAYSTSVKGLNLTINSKIIPFDKYYLTITCASTTDEFSTYKSIFNTIINSLEKINY